jgi:hypothetical protein
LGPPLKSLMFVEQLKETGKETHLKAANTRKSYAGHINRGREWLAGYFTVPDGGSPKELSWLAPDHVVGKDDPYTNPAFARAFDHVPNEFSDKALSLFLTHKGFDQGLGRNTVEGIRAAFKDLWDKAYVIATTNPGAGITDMLGHCSDGGRYRGKWQPDPVNPSQSRWVGNPVESAEVQDVMTSLKHKYNSEGGDRTHSLPMTRAYMEKMLSWSCEACPLLETALFALERAFDDMSVDHNAPVFQIDLKVRECITRHLERIAFDATAWTLWTRQVPLGCLRRFEPDES